MEFSWEVYRKSLLFLLEFQLYPTLLELKLFWKVRRVSLNYVLKTLKIYILRVKGQSFFAQYAGKNARFMIT